MRALFVTWLVLLSLAAGPAAAQSVSFSDALPEGPGVSEGIALWPSVAVRSGLAFAIPSDPSVATYVGPLGWSLGVDAKLNLGHVLAVGLRYMYTSFGNNSGSIGRLGKEVIGGQATVTQSIYAGAIFHELYAIAELPFVNSIHLRWSGILGVGIGIEQLKFDQYNVSKSGKPPLLGRSERQDTGPAFALGTTLEYFPVDFLSVSAGAQLSYRYSPNLSLDEGALTLQGLFGVEGHF